MNDCSSLAERLRLIGSETGFELSPHQIAQLQSFLSTLKHWNQRINLTALPLEGFPDATLHRLIREPLHGAALLRGQPTCWFDLGSGGGSPAIPMRLVLPAVKLTMVESKSRKAAFLREAARSAELSDTDVLDCRIEDLMTRVERASVNLISSRAVRIDHGVARSIRHVASASAQVLLFGPVDWTALRPEFTESVRDTGISVLTQ